MFRVRGGGGLQRMRVRWTDLCQWRPVRIRYRMGRESCPICSMHACFNYLNCRKVDSVPTWLIEMWTLIAFFRTVMHKIRLSIQSKTVDPNLLYYGTFLDKHVSSDPTFWKFSWKNWGFWSIAAFLRIRFDCVKLRIRPLGNFWIWIQIHENEDKLSIGAK